MNARQILIAWPSANADRSGTKVEFFDPALRGALPADVEIVDRSSEFDQIRGPAKTTILNDDGMPDPQDLDDEAHGDMPPGDQYEDSAPPR